MSGEVDLLVQSNTKLLQLDVLGANSVIGSVSVISERPFPFLARAKSNVTLLFLSKCDLLSFVDNSSHLSNAIEAVTKKILN